MDMKTELIKYVAAHSFLRSEEPVFLLSSGRMSDVYFDLRLTTLSPLGQYLIGNLVCDLIGREGLGVKAVGGLTMGADPVATATAFASHLRGEPLHAFVIRKEPKPHGRGRQVEGDVEPGDRVVILDDVITTGGSTIKAINIARAMGLDVAAALVVLDRCEQDGRANVEAMGMPMHSLLTIDDFR